MGEHVMSKRMHSTGIARIVRIYYIGLIYERRDQRKVSVLVNGGRFER